MLHTKRFGDVLILGVILALVLTGVFWLATAFAGTNESARGFAWSGSASVDGAYHGMGWISTNNLSDGGSRVYGMDIPAGNGNITGHAWSEHYGWISFNGSDLAGCAPALAQARRTGNNITGGARIIAIRDEGTNDGGYDGCIRLNGITITDGALDGYAWSSDLGWIDFSGVTALVPPEGLTATPNAACGTGKIAVSWHSVAGATKYTLQDGSTNIYANNGTSFTHTGLTNGSTHHYRVRAEIGAQFSEWSSVVTAIAPSACGSPAGTMTKTPSCTIAINAGTCVIPNITWNVTNPVTPALKQNTITPVTLSTTPGTVNSGPITYGTPVENTIFVTDGGVTLDTYIPEGLCVADSYWDPISSKCLQPNLTVQSLTVNGTPYSNSFAGITFTQGTPINLAGMVKNTGSVPTNENFFDNYTYSWDGGPWQPVGNSVTEPQFDGSTNATPHASLANNTTAPDNKIFTPSRGGTLRLQYCVDSANDIAEGAAGEVGNCVETGAMTVDSVYPDLTIVSFTIDGKAYDGRGGSLGTLTQGIPVNLVGTVKNSGAIAVPVAFSDNFSYSIDDGATWLPVGNSSSDDHFTGSKNFTDHVSGLPVNLPLIDSNAFASSVGGIATLRLQYCVDSGSTVTEGVAGEVGNCVQSVAITVDNSGGGGVVCLPKTTANHCELPNGVKDDVASGNLCSVGYTGNCEYKCEEVSPGIGDWTETSNSCVPDSSGTISANPNPLITPANQTTITWNTEDCPPASVTVQGGADTWTGVADDAKLSSVLVANTTYTLSCGPKALGSVNVTMRGPEIRSNKRIVSNIGDKVTISWDACPGGKVNGSTLRDVDASVDGSVPNVPVNANTVFSLTCGGVPTDTVTVEITGWQAGT